MVPAIGSPYASDGFTEAQAMAGDSAAEVRRPPGGARKSPGDGGDQSRVSADSVGRVWSVAGIGPRVGQNGA